MKKLSLLISLTAILLISACGTDSRAYMQQGKPENLLDNSSEKVNFSLNSSGVADVVAWINKDQPTRAEISCGGNQFECQQAEAALSNFGVPYRTAQARSGDGNVTLFYDRVMARECDPRYVSNNFNPDNLNHKTFGCAVASNMVKQVTNKTEFTNPSYMDTQDAEKAVAVFKSYQKGKSDCCCKGKGGCPMMGGKGGCAGGVCNMKMGMGMMNHEMPSPPPAHKKNWRANPASASSFK